MNINRLLDHLEKVRALEVVVSHGSVRAAARHLRLTQPGLSRTIAALEAALDLKLLVRKRTGVSATPEGFLIAELGRKLGLAAAESIQQLAALVVEESPIGTVRCVCHEVIAGYLWPTLVAAAARLAPRLELVLETMPSRRDMIKALSVGKFDLAIGVELAAGRNLQTTFLYSDTYGLFVAKSSGAANAATIAELPANSITFFPQSLAGKGVVLGEALLALGYTSKSRYDISSYETLLTMAVAGLTTVVLPRRPFRVYCAAGLLTEQTCAGKPAAIGQYDIECVTRKGLASNSVARVMQERILPYAVNMMA